MEKSNTPQSETITLYTVDADDFCEENSQEEILEAIHAANPSFKITLFVIPFLCSPQFIRKWQRKSWVELVPHGLLHPDPRECENWSYEKSKEYLKTIEPIGLVKGFKAPGWQISDGMYRALLEEGYWVADQAYNNERRPKELKAYILDAPEKLHYHIGHMGGHNANEIAPYAEYLKVLPGRFQFVSEAI